MYAKRSPNHTPVSSPVTNGKGEGPANRASRGLLPSGYRHTSSANAGDAPVTAARDADQTIGRVVFRETVISGRAPSEDTDARARVPFAPWRSPRNATATGAQSMADIARGDK